MSNFIIKPDGLFPSTYSQMGRVLIPSKNCNNRKIARKYDEKGSTSVLNTQTGIKTLSAPYISTFKQFDRPGPLISEECQPCRIVSVPSVTDKTVYPCSSGKYSVTGYVDASNKIGVLGNSMFPRITTSDYQLYQQYRDVTEKKNITGECPCPFTLENGYYIDSSEQLPFPIIYKDCELCLAPFKIFLGRITDLQQINNCKYIINYLDDSGPQSVEATISANNTITVANGVDEPFIITYKPPTPVIFDSSAVAQDSVLDKVVFGTCPIVNITDLTININNNVVTFKDNGQSKSFNKFIQLVPNSTYVIIDGDVIYILQNISGVPPTYQISFKVTCDCVLQNTLSTPPPQSLF